MENKPSVGRLTTNLSKHVLAHNFDKAQALIDEGIPFSTGIMFQILLKDNIKALEFCLKNNLTIRHNDIVMAFTEDLKNSDKFKTLIIAEKFKNKELENIFNDKDKLFNTFKQEFEFFTDEAQILDPIHNRKNNLRYDINEPIENVLEIKDFISKFNKAIDGFYELKEFLPKLSDEQELQLSEWKKLATNSKHIYDTYISDRKNLNNKNETPKKLKL